MIGNFEVVAIIPARGGSKAIKNKNLRNLGEKPLVCWPINSSLEVSEIDQVIVSTDDIAIAEVSEKCGATVQMRPHELATDRSLVIDTIRDLIPKICKEKDRRYIFLLLEPTSPFRSSNTIRRCITRIVDDGFDSVATFSEAAINPERVWTIKKGIPAPYIDGAVPWLPRQELKPAYELNGAVYAFIADQLPKTGHSLLFGNYAGEIISQDEVIDIDTEKDLKVANALLAT